jgi:hypothetical protein
MTQEASYLPPEHKDLEKKLIVDLSISEAWKHVEYLTANAPQRLSGTPEEKLAVEYFRKTLEGYGVKPDVHEFDGLVSFPGDSELLILSPERRAIPSQAYAHITSTPLEGIEAEVVYVGSGGTRDYEGLDVRGKLTLAELSYAPPRPEKIRIAELHGAVGQIQMNWGMPDSKVLPLGTTKSVWGNPTPETIKMMPRIPAISISRADGLWLKGLCQRGTVKVWMRAEALRSWKPITEITGDIQGSAESEKFVLVGGHFDAWGGGVTCNATGNAMLLELARVFSKYRSYLRRGVRFAWWTAHETGIMEGSTWYVDNFWSDLNRNAVAYMNCDSPGMRDTTVYLCSSSAEAMKFHLETIRETFGPMPIQTRRPVKTGDQSFFGLGLPSIEGRTIHPKETVESLGGATLGWWYHSIQDTLDKADKGALETLMKAYAVLISRLCNSIVLPFDFVPLADEFIKVLSEINERCNKVLPLRNAIRLAEALRERAVKLNAEIAATLEKCRNTDLRRERQMEGRIRALNCCLMRLSRILNPINYTLVGRYDQDTYGSSDLAQPVPILQPALRLAGLNPNTSEFRALKTKLVRENNKVCDALEDAVSVIESTLERL